MATIITVPNPILREISSPITNLGKKTLRIIRNIEQALQTESKPRGVGLSAVQIGKPIRVFSTYLPQDGTFDKNKKPIIKTYINPKITKKSKKITLGKDKKKPILEGCLSIPAIWGPVPRHQWVKLSYHQVDENTDTFKEKKEKFSDFQARVIQHELDHLNGILFTDYSIKNNLPLYEDLDGKLQEITLEPQ